MAIYSDGTRYEFDLTIKKYGNKNQERGMYDPSPREEKRTEELKEKLTFNSRTAVEVIRKLLDYLNG